MKVRESKYLFKEGLKNTWVNGIMSLASVLTVLACLIILGLFLLLSMNLNHLAADIQGQYELIVRVDESVPDDQMALMQATISGFDNVQDVQLVTKAEAMEDLREDLGEDSGILEGLEGENNPLRNSFHISLEDLSQVDVTAQAVQGVQGVAEVRNNRELTDQLLRITDVIKIITFWILFLLVVMTVIIISNTVKVAMFARRKEINIMKFIGATDHFIRLPFIVEGVVIALVGCVIAFVLVFFAYQYFYASVGQSYSWLITFVPVREAGLVVAAYFVVLSILMGVVGSVISIRKYLKV